MPINDSRDNFPDMTIPDRETPVEQPAGGSRKSSDHPWTVGDAVLAPWEPDFLYTGVIQEIKTGQAKIQFDDGDEGWVQLNLLRPLALPIGQKVLSRRRMGQVHYRAEIMEVNGQQVLVRFDDGYEDEWTSIGALRIPCQPTGQGADPTEIASHQIFLKNLQPGDRVWAPWQSETLFAGTVDKQRGDEVHIRFDDGDKGWVLRDQLLPLDIPIGLPVMSRRKMGNQYYPAVVTNADGERIQVQFEDGRNEWTTPAAIALIAEAYGPDARPTGGSNYVRGGSAAWGWVATIGIGILLALIRMACRQGMQ